MLITYQAQLLEKKEIAPDIYLVRFSYPDNKEWNYKAGQYMIFHIPKEEKGHPARRLYSIASSPLTKDQLDFVIEIIPNGLGSTFIKNLKLGETATLQGPAGLFTFKESERDTVFLATGTGIAPIYSMIKTILSDSSNIKHQTSNLHLFWGMKYAKDLYLMDELRQLAATYTNFHLTVCLSREEGELDEHCIKGRVTQGIEQSMQPLTDYDYYICGGPHVVESLKEYLIEKEIPREQVHFEKFT